MEDTGIIKEALTIYIARMDENVREIQWACVREEMTGEAGTKLIKEFEDQKKRAMKIRKELPDKKG